MFSFFNTFSAPPSLYSSVPHLVHFTVAVQQESRYVWTGNEVELISCCRLGLRGILQSRLSGTKNNEHWVMCVMCGRCGWMLYGTLRAHLMGSGLSGSYEGWISASANCAAIIYASVITLQQNKNHVSACILVSMTPSDQEPLNKCTLCLCDMQILDHDNLWGRLVYDLHQTGWGRRLWLLCGLGCAGKIGLGVPSSAAAWLRPPKLRLKELCLLA